MQVSSKAVVKTMMGPLSRQVKINVSESRHKTIRSNAFPVVAVRKNESYPVMNGKPLVGNKACEKAALMAFFHGSRIFPVEEHFCPDCFGVKTAYDDPFSVASM
jgi:hypothetical protein